MIDEMVATLKKEQTDDDSKKDGRPKLTAYQTTPTQPEGSRPPQISGWGACRFHRAFSMFQNVPPLELDGPNSDFGLGGGGLLGSQRRCFGADSVLPDVLTP